METPQGKNDLEAIRQTREKRRTGGGKAISGTAATDRGIDGEGAAVERDE
jgi:hypothetical protein